MASCLATTFYGCRYSIFFTICVAVLVGSEPCGEPPLCSCSTFRIVECTNPNTTIFPSFLASETNDVHEVIIHNTGISTLPLFDVDKWPSLKLVSTWNNTALPCENISRLRRPGLAVTSTCTLLDIGDPIPAGCVLTTPPERTSLRSLVFALPPIMFAMIASSLLAYRARNSKHYVPPLRTLNP